MANHGVTDVVGKGNINLETDLGCRLILRDVRHIPDIRLNIISTGKLDDDGYVIVNSSSIELWYKRLGHLSQKGMQLLAKKKLLPDVSTIELQTCADYLAGKQHRVAFKSFYSFRKSHPLTWCIQMLEKSIPKTPQHNGVAERMNRTICELIKCMLSHSKLPKSFLGEAMRTVVDLINLSLSTSLAGDIPYRVWSGKDISYKHLRVFGCRAFVHIPKDKRSKLDDKTKPCTFLGYGHEEFGYILWDPVNRKVIRSRDIVFLEKQISDDIKQREMREFS
ncbi:hypothetical protein BUALT_Bualt01G0101500 [Buddleja alternifolia]|uniref:Integrase catalytic domain-containing protein n=1 Tax=Buddleja alternifolia TaxID=168488 RepID=A0AAV6Y5Y8_9LAMI|nr:hypothetical protein BUALT_Bualt01G0101500 [Buddleja alternifolia]